jgi:hypothetical protein
LARFVAQKQAMMLEVEYSARLVAEEVFVLLVAVQSAATNFHLAG